MDRINRIYRIGEDLTHARWTLHAASALKPPRKRGFKNLYHEAREEHEGKMGGDLLRSGNREISVFRNLGLEENL